jgi:hypothetical protein
MALAKKEMKDHQTPDMDALFLDMSSRPLIVEAVPIDGDSVDTPGYTSVCTKRVHLAR